MGAELYTFSGRCHKICEKNFKRKKNVHKGSYPFNRGPKNHAHGFQIKMDSKTPSTPNGEEEIL